MKEEIINKANEISNEIKRLDGEIDKLFDFMPPVKENWIVSFIGTKFKKKIIRYGHEIELTNEDMQTLIELRCKLVKELKKQLEEM